MQQISIVLNTEYKQLIKLWELSARATHNFLAEKDFNYYKQTIPKYFAQANLYAARDNAAKLLGFMGTAENSIEMLFVHPQKMGQGIGKLLVNYARQELKIKKVAVNAQNKQALRFYRKLGFRAVSRSASDNEGPPYPILRLALK
ncbi:MAG: GNAT family N-acetyltransferase [Candidatus Margulisbacteria bacterium]|jgi:putative acetyltransferase|nr:GNAT family N-acetyltransferase [Candidatus Margulisiibacteriota bacterium]